MGENLNILIYSWNKYYNGAILKATNILGTRIVKAIAIGNNWVHITSINWSYLIRGKVALLCTNKNIKKQVLSPKIIACKLIIVLFTKISGINQPPVNRIALNELINTIEQYSPKKKNTNIIAECSVKKPATNSDSASWRSKGVLLVSAKIEIKNNIKTGNKGTMYQIACWFSIIAVKLNVPDNNTTMITAVLKINSYEIIAAVLLNAYLYKKY